MKHKKCGELFGLSHRTKGAISVFLVLIYIWVFALMGILVDGGRIRMAEAQTEEIQQLANESMMTYYSRGLYEYYDLFGETEYSAEEMTGMMQEMMVQAMTAKPGATLQSQMGASFLFSTDGKSYFDPYDLKVDSITAGSNLNLANDEVFKSQINDAMKYSGPLILANNFLNVLESLGASQQGVQAVSECNDAVSQVTDDISDYADTIQKLRNELYNFCDNPDGPLSTSARNNGTVFDPSEYAGDFDEAAEKAINSIVNNTQDALDDLFSGDDKEGEGGEEEQETGPSEEELSAVDADIDKAYEKYSDKMNAIHENAADLYQQLDDAATRGGYLKTKIKNQQDSLNSQASGKDADVAGIYTDYAKQLETSAKYVDQYYHTLMELNDCVERMVNTSNPTVDGFEKAAEDVQKTLKETHDASQASMKDDRTVSNYNRGLVEQMRGIMDKLDGLSEIDDGEEALKEAEKKVKEKANDTKVDSKPKNTNRLGVVTTVSENNTNVKDYSADKYDRKNASSKAKEVSGTVSNLCSTFLGDMAGSLRDNLFEDAYVLSYFRNYVHTCNMPEANVGKDGYDTVANAKFRQGDSYLTAEQYQSIETTCAEAEYVLYGSKNTVKDASAAYASIYAIRLAFDYTSVFLCAGSRSTVMAAASSAGLFAPVVLALLPFSYAVPRAALDMESIMKGSCTPLMINDDSDWFKTSFNNTDYLVGYSDYLLILLVMMDQNKKVDRMQDIIQMNMKKLDSDFTLDTALVDVYVQTDCSVKYVFMTEAFMPAQFRLDGRHTFQLATSVSY